MAIDELRKVRKDLGLSLDKGSEVGVTRQTLASIEKGESDIGIELLKKLAELYKYDLVIRLEKRIGSRMLQVDLLSVFI